MSMRNSILTIVILSVAVTGAGCSFDASKWAGQIGGQPSEIRDDSAGDDARGAITQSQDRSHDPDAMARENQPDAGQSATAFTPPYPDRHDPFRQPVFRRLADDQQQPTVDASNVQLKGFLNVRGVRALVAINGDVNVLQEGDEMDGLRVIEVSPPKIILQRGRIRWTEDLYAIP